MGGTGLGEGLLSLVFALAGLLQDGETRLFGVGDRERLEFDRRAKGGNDLAHGFLAGGAMG